jgi:4-amino-4-deoxy-L-arabinose transferase-like glycosyltransferase
MWSRHLAAGYFDHPPMIAVLIRSGTALFGSDTRIAVRFGPWLAGSAGVVLSVMLAHRLGGLRAARRAALLTVALPAVVLGLVPATPDVALFASLACLMWTVLRAVDAQPGSGEARRWWLAAGAALGAAVASKLPGAVAGVGILLALGVHPGLRWWLRRPEPWLGAAVAVAISVPTVVWNAHHDWVSFRFQLHHGLGASAEGGVLAALQGIARREGGFLAALALVASPVLCVLLIAAMRRGLRRSAEAGPLAPLDGERGMARHICDQRAQALDRGELARAGVPHGGARARGVRRCGTLPPLVWTTIRPGVRLPGASPRASRRGTRKKSWSWSGTPAADGGD